MNNLVIINGQINTMNPFQPYAQAVAIKNGRIIAVGSNEEIKQVMPFDAEIIDAKGNSVFPGFIDTHAHFSMTGQNASQVDVYSAESKEDFIRILKEKEKTLPPGVWLQGTGYDETQYPGKALPTIEELDAAFPDRPIIVGRVDAHQLCLNSIAFKELGVNINEKGVELNEDGTFSGVIKDPANGIVKKLLADKLMTEEMRRNNLHIASEVALKKGTTTICALEGGTVCDEADVPVFLKYQDELPIHTHLFHQIIDVDKVVSEGQKSIGGCICLDGSMGSRTAAFLDDYADCAGYKGELYYTPKEIEDFVMEAHCKGLQISMHCIGDRAIETLLQAYEKALYKYPRNDHRHRFEHFSVPTYNQMIRAKNLGCYIAIQPSFVYPPAAPEIMLNDRLGEERINRAYPFRTLMEVGLPVAGGSDSPVTLINPFRGIVAGMHHYQKSQRFSLYEGLKMFTADAAKFTFEEKEKGTIEVGKLGDIAIIEGNIWNMDVDDIEGFNDIKFLYTIVAGEIKYKA